MPTRLDQLFSKHLQGDLSTLERTELYGLLLEPGQQERLKVLLAELWEGDDQTQGLTEMELEELVSRIAVEENSDPVPVKRLFPWKRWVAAASMIIALSLGFYFLSIDKNDTIASAKVKTDVKAPSGNKARIRLADGREIELDSAGNGELVLQGNVNLEKLSNGKIAYRLGDAGSAQENVFNTLTNPRGSRVIDMQLSDGTRIWLNAGSSVTYPVAFSGKERSVTMTGEAYFEVTHDIEKPFIIRKNDLAVQVLGTRFNVNTYEDEPAAKVTLLQGSVNVTKGQQGRLLKPGQQAVVASQISLGNAVDTVAVMAWKNGSFQFSSLDIETTMRQLARWYDVEIVYEGEKPSAHFTGEISLDVEASKVLKMLEATGAVHFRIEGRKVFVSK